MIIKKIILNGIEVGSYESTGSNEKDISIVQKYLKDNGLYKEITLNDQMIGQANSFAKIAESIYKNDLKVSPYKGSSVSPFIVNAAFSIELYLKTIHDAYGNKIKGHHLGNLYKKMPDNGKVHFLSTASDLRPHYNLLKNSDINMCLESLSYAFERWRYIYEHDRLETELQSIRYALNVSFEACCRVRDEISQTSLADKTCHT